MKHIFSASVMFIMAALCSCNESFISTDYYIPSDTIHYDPVKDNVPVILSMTDPFYITISRGSGAIDVDRPHVKENATFHVYAFLTNNYAYKGEIDYTRKFVADGNVGEDDVIQCLVDNPETGMGAATRLQNNMMLDFVDNTSYYYNSINQDYKYNFYAYYVDDAEIEGNRAVREKDNIHMNIKIDGTQDIVSAIASITDKQIQSIDPEEDKWFFSNVLNNELVYSTLTGHRFIVPVLNAKHCMSRFKFKIVGEDAMSDGIYIQDIYVKAQRDWRFTVAADDFSKVGLSLPGGAENLEEVHLCDEIGEIDGSRTSLEQYTYHVAKNETIDDLGMGLLLPPREKYDLFIKCAYVAPDGKVRSYVTKYTLNSRYVDNEGNLVNKSFEAGAVYNISIHVYGYQTIELSMDGLEWGPPVELPPLDEDQATDEDFIE